MNDNNDWAADALIYHLYPLGCLGAPARNPMGGEPVHRLRELLGWVDYLADLVVGALYLGPVFESSGHGYDTIDYFKVDRRLGDDADLAALAAVLHTRGIKLILDAVFNHTGRDFWAFRELREQGPGAPHAHWYRIDSSRRSPYGDPFHYEGWAGHYELVKLDVGQPQVRDHLLHAVSSWMERYDIDGLRLDAADALSREFQSQLAAHCRARKPGFWLMGEVVHGDYRQWAHPGGLDAITNYEAYKGLWSSHNDANFFEIAYALERQFGPHGLYRDIGLVNFADNHDVDRIASTLRDRAQLASLYLLLMTMPGTPAIYYGSEWGVSGRRQRGSDAALRPALSPETMRRDAPEPQLFATLQALIALRRDQAALRRGDYRQLNVAKLQLSFERRLGDERLVVAINADATPAPMTLKLREADGRRLADLLQGGAEFRVEGGRCEIDLPPHWGRVLKLSD